MMMNLKCFMLTQLHSQVREICSENIVKTLTAFIFFPMRGMMYLSYGTVFSHLSLENKNVGKHFYLLLKIFGRKQLSRDVLRKRCYENMQQIYRWRPMPKSNFNKVALLCNFIEIALRQECSPVNLLHIFRTSFPKNTSGRLLTALVVVTRSSSLQFVIFKPLRYCFEEIIGFDVKASFVSRPV